MNRLIFAAFAFAPYLLGAPPAAPVFEVASIKPSKPMPMGEMRIMMGADAGMLRYSNVSLRDCIRTAYRLKDFQIQGPDTLGERFDIVAKLPEGASQELIPDMLQALLVERFHLQTHRETKEHAIYALVTKGEPKLKPAEARIDPPPGPGPAGSGMPRGAVKMMMGPEGAHLNAPAATLPMLAEMISRFTERPIVDMTGIKGEYNFDLVFTPEVMRGMPGGPMPGPAPRGEHRSQDAPPENAGTIYQAVQAYGLKLEPRKAPMDVLIVDRIDKEPTEN